MSVTIVVAIVFALFSPLLKANHSHPGDLDPGFGSGGRSGSPSGPGVIVSTLFVALVADGSATAEPGPEQWLSEAEAAYSKVTTYTAIFHKQQRVDGKLLPEETIFLKFRKPSSLYMKWVRDPYEGSELLYEVGRNEDRVKAHRGGVLRFVTRNLDPSDPGLMAGNLRPVTSTGIGYLLETVAINIRKAIKAGDLTFAERGQETVYGRNTQVLEMVIAKDRARDYDGCRFVINQDIESKVLVRIRVYDRDDQLIENYGYESVDLNAPLVDADLIRRIPSITSKGRRDVAVIPGARFDYVLCKALSAVLRVP